LLSNNDDYDDDFDDDVDVEDDYGENDNFFNMLPEGCHNKEHITSQGYVVTKQCVLRLNLRESTAAASE